MYWRSWLAPGEPCPPLPRKKPASSTGLPPYRGENWRNSLLLRKATISSGAVLTLTLAKIAPKPERICSNLVATSRARFSPPSVATEKWGEVTSTHCWSARAAEKVQAKREIRRKLRRIIGTLIGDQGWGMDRRVPRS